MKRRGQKSKHNVCVPTSIRIELNGACDRSGAAVTSLEELYLPRSEKKKKLSSHRLENMPTVDFSSPCVKLPKQNTRFEFLEIKGI